MFINKGDLLKEMSLNDIDLGPAFSSSAIERIFSRDTDSGPKFSSSAIERIFSGYIDPNKRGLRIGTYNTHLVSLPFKIKLTAAGDFLGDPVGFVTNHIAEVTSNARQIASRILSSGYDYDVIALNEVFSEEARKILVSKLSPEYPHYLEKLTYTVSVAPAVKSVIADYFKGIIGELLDALKIVDLANLMEDSGLMLFSRFPIIDSRFKAFTFPTIGAITDAAPDSLAYKGVGYARILHPHTSLHYNILFAHLQTNDDEYKWTRDMEMEQIQKFISEIMTDYEIRSNDLFLMGDLNIDGSWKSEHLKDPSKINELKREVKPEWKSHFDNPSSFFTKRIRDAWFYETSTMDKGFTNPGRNQRLDHILHTPSMPHTQILEVQHITKAYNLLSPLGKNFSDHYGINADLNFSTLHCNPRKSKVLSKEEIEKDEPIDGEINFPGGMVWYRIDMSGTFSIAVRGDEGVDYAIYQSVDLSLPLANYKGEKRDLTDKFERTFTASKYVMTDPPYYIRVYIPIRTAIGKFKLFVHRHAGIDKADAITCYPNEYCPKQPDMSKPDEFAQVFPVGKRINSDDTVWFQFDTLRADSGEPKDIECEVSKYKKAIYRMNLYRDDGTSLKLIDSTGPNSSKLTLTIHDDIGPSKIYLTVTRDDPTYPEDTMAVIWKSNLTIFHGLFLEVFDKVTKLRGVPDSQALELECEEITTPRNGSDEINIKLWVDGTQRLDQNLGDFQSGDVRGLEDIIPKAGYRYLHDIVVVLDEIDVDVGGDHSDSSGPKTIPFLSEPRPIPVPNDNKIFEFQGGKYNLKYNLSWQVPTE